MKLKLAALSIAAICSLATALSIAKEEKKAQGVAKVTYELLSCATNHSNCISVNKFDSSGACEKALKAYKLQNPGRAAGCNKIP